MHRLFRPLIALALAGLANAGGAVPLTFNFSASVTDDPFGLSSFGAPIVGSYTFDSAALDSIPDVTTGSYLSAGPAYGFSANVDGTIYNVSGSVTVNTSNDIGVDQYGVIAIDGALMLELFFEDGTQTALGSDALPLGPPALGSYATHQFRLFGQDVEFRGVLDSLTCVAGCSGVVPSIPEPSSSELSLLGLIAVGLLSWTRRSSALRGARRTRST